MKELQAISIGQQFDDPRVRNVRFKSSETLLGADVAILNLSGVLEAYDRDLTPTYQGSPLLNENDSFRSDKDIARRKNEISKLLSLGKTVVVFVPPPLSWFVATGKKEYSGTGRNRQTTNIVTGRHIHELFPFELRTAAAVSSDLELTSSGPFASFWASTKDRFEATATLRKYPGDTTINIAGTDESVGAIAQVESGVLILLPGSLLYEDFDYPDDEREFVDPQDVSFLDPLFELIKELRRGSGDFELPDWAEQYRLPGESQALDSVKQAEEVVENVLVQRDEHKRELVERQQRKLLVAGSGAALESVVEEALTALGFRVEEAKPNRADRIARRSHSSVVVEIKGKGKSASESDATQLEKWVAEFIEEEGKTPKALLIVNGWRKTPLGERTKAVFPDQMISYSEKREHCLMTGGQLLAAWAEVEEKPRKKAEIVKSILNCIGRYDRYPEDGGDVLTREDASRIKKEGR